MIQKVSVCILVALNYSTKDEADDSSNDNCANTISAIDRGIIH